MPKKQSLTGPIVAVAIIVSTTLPGVAAAQTVHTVPAGIQMQRKGPGKGFSGAKRPGLFAERQKVAPGVLGTLSSMNGSMLTVLGKHGTTTFTVDASKAKVLKATEGSAPQEIQISELKAGDVVGIKGTVTGTNVVATEIFTGRPPRPPMPFMEHFGTHMRKLLQK